MKGFNFKKRVYIWVFIASIVSCKEIVYLDKLPSLEILVTDPKGTTIEKAIVRIFDNEDAWLLDQKPIVSDTTNSDGVVLFEELQLPDYHILVSKGNLNNRNGISKIVKRLDPNTISKLTILIE